ncbi:MAG: 50S ribosomal protein L21 [Chlamydiae bacterium RIFCSPHIGHO2_12_FULL_27_8]|nr:MAG: 50S ribosomal protein L21 [Chlamydiae bacterium RIFCSPHIGHO2_12_FULL_27_8]
MYAIIQTGSKQFKVEEGNIIDVELLDLPEGKVEFKEVLLFNDGSKITIGDPIVKNCIVSADIIEEIKGPKVITYKYKKRKNFRKKKGHRQQYTKVKITEIKIS